MLAGVAVAILLVGGVSAYIASLNNSANGAIPAQQGDTARMQQAVSTPAPVVNLSRELDQVSPTDSTPELARAALLQLTRLDSAAQTADDSTRVQLRFLRGKALMTSGDVKSGCDSLNAIQGKLERSRFRRAAMPILDYCAKQ
jgi:hypothetical protein